MAEWLIARAFDTLLTPFGAISACAWHGISLRRSSAGGLDRICDDIMTMCAFVFLLIAFSVVGIVLSIALALYTNNSSGVPAAGCFIGGWIAIVWYAQSSPMQFIIRGRRFGRGIEAMA